MGKRGQTRGSREREDTQRDVEKPEEKQRKVGPSHSEMNKRRGVSPEETKRPSIKEGGTAGAGQEEEGARWEEALGPWGGVPVRTEVQVFEWEPGWGHR